MSEGYRIGAAGVIPRVGFVSLGCPKATSDSEQILTRLRAEGYEVVGTYDQADLVVVNTCGFVDDAVHESLDTIGEALRENGKVVVTGCLGARPEQILERHPQVLKITGPHAFDEVMDAVHEHLPPAHDPFLDLGPPQGIRLTPRHYAYLKISEGCNHRCSFCIIPSMRGDLVSRPLPHVLNEAIRLRNAGVRELLVISQDTSAYGVDVKYRAEQWGSREVRTRFIDLARELGQLAEGPGSDGQPLWVRLHYVYPYPHVDEVIPLMAAGHAENTLERLKARRRGVPDLAVRSTFIVGFPGETEEEFQVLLDWLDEAQLDRVGAFKYSPVEGAPANALANPVPEEVKQERYERFMAKAAAISAARLQQKVGRKLTVLVDAIEGSTVIARSYADAPDIDGTVRVRGSRALAAARVGEFLEVEITGALVLLP